MYGYATFSSLVSALRERLQDTLSGYTTSTGYGFVTAAEAQLYLIEALQTLNALTAIWNQDYTLPFTSATPWQNISGISGSPRQRTTTDTQIYTLMEYHLLEPPSGGAWTGTTQFNITDLSQALQYRRDEILAVTGANIVRFLQPSPTSSQRTILPDTVSQLRRVRWIPTGTDYSAWPLCLEDRITTDAYGNQDLQDTGQPESYMPTATAPLQFDCSSVPPVPGQWDILALESGTVLAPPAATVLGLPNDWCWVSKWGALADCLGNSPERQDAFRARYSMERYQRGLKAMNALPWLLDVNIAGLVSDSPSVAEADAYAPGWETSWPSGDPQVVVGGMDLVALAPFVTTGTVSADLTVVGNAPVDTTQDVQLGRDAVDAVLAYAQHLAMFKCGGAEFAATFPLYQQFEDYCATINRRYKALGIARMELISEGGREDVFNPREEVNA